MRPGPFLYLGGIPCSTLLPGAAGWVKFGLAHFSNRLGGAAHIDIGFGADWLCPRVMGLPAYRLGDRLQHDGAGVYAAARSVRASSGHRGRFLRPAQADDLEAILALE